VKKGYVLLLGCIVVVFFFVDSKVVCSEGILNEKMFERLFSTIAEVAAVALIMWRVIRFSNSSLEKTLSDRIDILDKNNSKNLETIITGFDEKINIIREKFTQEIGLLRTTISGKVAVEVCEERKLYEDRILALMEQSLKTITTNFQYCPHQKDKDTTSTESKRKE
jgi:hypothetical protein